MRSDRISIFAVLWKLHADLAAERTDTACSARPILRRPNLAICRLYQLRFSRKRIRPTCGGNGMLRSQPDFGRAKRGLARGRVRQDTQLERSAMPVRIFRIYVRRWRNWTPVPARIIAKLAAHDRAVPLRLPTSTQLSAYAVVY